MRLAAEAHRIFTEELLDQAYAFPQPAYACCRVIEGDTRRRVITGKPAGPDADLDAALKQENQCGDGWPEGPVVKVIDKDSVASGVSVVASAAAISAGNGARPPSLVLGNPERGVAPPPTCAHTHPFRTRRSSTFMAPNRNGRGLLMFPQNPNSRHDGLLCSLSHSVLPSTNQSATVVARAPE